MPPLIAQLLASGLSLLGGTLLDKGREAVEAKLGVTLPAMGAAVSPEKIAELRTIEFTHEEKLLELATMRAVQEMEAEKSAQSAVSDRWKADMTSDSWAAKNIRPAVLAYLTVVISLMAFASQWLRVDPAWVDLLKVAYVTVIGAYFVGRTAEKGTSIVRSKS